MSHKAKATLRHGRGENPIDRFQMFIALASVGASYFFREPDPPIRESRLVFDQWRNHNSVNPTYFLLYIFQLIL